MSDRGSETRAQAATRRRWVTLAEFVAVAGLLIGVTTLYLNWSDRREDRVAKSAEVTSARKASGIVTLRGEVVDGGDGIALSDADRVFSAATIRFPAELGIPAQDAMPGPRLDADDIAAPLLKLTDKGSDDRTGRIPALITVTWWDGNDKHRDTALYDILWRTEGRMLQGRKLRLAGFALNDRIASAPALEKAWTREKPTT